MVLEPTEFTTRVSDGHYRPPPPQWAASVMSLCWTSARLIAVVLTSSIVTIVTTVTTKTNILRSSPGGRREGVKFQIRIVASQLYNKAWLDKDYYLNHQTLKKF